MNTTYALIRVRRLAGDAIKRNFPKANLSIILRVMEKDAQSLLVQVNSRTNATIVKNYLRNFGYSAKIVSVDEEETEVLLEISELNDPHFAVF